MAAGHDNNSVAARSFPGARSGPEKIGRAEPVTIGQFRWQGGGTPILAFGMRSTASVGYAWAYLKATLFRLNARIAAWSSGRWNHWHAAAAHRRHRDAGIGASWWTDHAFGCGELIAQRSAAYGFAGAWCSVATRQATTLIRWLRKRRRSSRPLGLGVCDGGKWRCDGRDDGRNAHGSHVMSPRLIESNAGHGIIVPPAWPGGTSIVMRKQPINR
jgi:hypothetical protein